MSDSTPAWLVVLAEEVDELALHIKRYGREDASDIARRMRALADILEQRI